MTQFGQTYLQSRASFFTESVAHYRNGPGENLYILTYVSTESNQLYLSKFTNLKKQWTVSVSTPDSSSYLYATITWNEKGVYVLNQGGGGNGSVSCNIYRYSLSDGSLLGSKTQSLSSTKRAIGIHSVFNTGDIVIVALSTLTNPTTELHKYDFELTTILDRTEAFEWSGSVAPYPGYKNPFGAANISLIPLTIIGADNDIYIATDGGLFQNGGGSTFHRWDCPRIRWSDLRWNNIDPDTLDIIDNFNSVYGYVRGGFGQPSYGCFPVSDWAVHIGDQRNIVHYTSNSGLGAPNPGRDGGRDFTYSNPSFEDWENTGDVITYKGRTGYSMATYNDPYILISKDVLQADSRATDATAPSEIYTITAVFTDADEESNARVHTQLPIKNGPNALVIGSYASHLDKLWFGKYDYTSGTTGTKFKNYDHEDIDLTGHRLRWAALAQPGEGRYGYRHYRTKGTQL